MFEPMGGVIATTNHQANTNNNTTVAVRHNYNRSSAED